jgi:iron(III) transport system permease protein
VSVVLSRPGSEVLAVQILNFADDGLWGKLSALGIVMILISTGLVLLATLAGRKFRSLQIAH